MELPVPGDATLAESTPSGYAVIDGKAICTDEWDGYPAARDRLVEAMADRGGARCCVGRRPLGWAFEGPVHPDGEPVAVEFTAPCVTSTPMARQLPKGWRRLAAGMADKLPEARWFELERHGLILDVEADDARADWFSIDIEDPAAQPDPASSWRHDLATPGSSRRSTRGRCAPTPPDEVAGAHPGPATGRGRPGATPPTPPGRPGRRRRGGRRGWRAWACASGSHR